MNKYYISSGKSSPNSIFFFLLSTCIIIPILSVIYIYLVWYIPIIYINIIVTAGFGFAISIVVSYLSVRMGKVRNTKIALLFGIIGGLIGVYIAWALWIDLVINSGESYGNSRIGITTSSTQFGQVFALITHPGAIIDFAKEINEYGTWGFRGTSVSGVFLSAIWLIELLIIVVISALTPYFRSKQPFCEYNNKWFEEKVLPPFNYIENTQSLITKIENQDKNSFEEVKPSTTYDTENHSVFTLFSSENGDNYLTINNNLAKRNKDSEIEFEQNEFVTCISINNPLKELISSKH